MLDLGYGSFGRLVDWLVDPPLPPPGGLGAAHVHRQCPSWSPGPSIFQSCVRFDFGFNFGLVLNAFGGRLGLLLAPFWEPNSGQVGPKMCLDRFFLKNVDFHADLRFPMFFCFF